MELNVIGNAKKNLIFGVLNKVVTIIMNPLCMTMIQRILGTEYLGLNGLFSSVVSVLSLSEMGVGAAVVYSMYKPVAENDTAAVCALLNLYRKIYAVIGGVILALGLCLIPFLPRLISGSYPEDVSLAALYLIYLANTVISYFMFAYMSSLLVVYQREDINSRTNMYIMLLLGCSQLAVLWLTGNYYLYIILTPLFTVANNLRIAWITRRLFPQYRCEGSISREMAADIRERVSGAFIGKCCGVTRNSLDSICISAFLGLKLTGIYNNYYTVMVGVGSILGLVSSALQGGVGNHTVTRSAEENFRELKKMNFVYMWVSCWCAVCLACLYQPFMQLWMGKDMLLPFSAVALLCLYFYLLKIGDMISIYSTARGLWWKHRYRSLVETAGNILLNILLGRFFGVHGIIAATIITLFFCNILWGSQIVCSSYFGRGKLKEYLSYQFRYLGTTVVVCTINYLLCACLPFRSLYGLLICRLLICVFIPNIIWISLYHKKDEFAYSMSVILKK